MKERESIQSTKSDSLFKAHVYTSFFPKTVEKNNEVEGSEKAEIRKAEFSAVGGACTSIH